MFFVYVLLFLEQDYRAKIGLVFEKLVCGGDVTEELFAVVPVCGQGP